MPAGQIEIKADQLASGGRAVPPVGQAVAVEGDHLVELRMRFDQIDECRADQPTDVRIRPASAEKIEHGQSMDDVAQRTGLDNEDAPRGWQEDAACHALSGCS